ncbi:hypothetical protein LGK97_05605 [Clostridium sp. CS001]|uniref:hypothetical protein n=1 Tax=Clostridium sp. CS001 TaxID=2880648 RepID=UPI001CF123C3|nr:hypothetical protein [Clostridium sp. CS001]MCB2289239.1 hypothetical protein [Clostridium sp. CS001]
MINKDKVSNPIIPEKSDKATTIIIPEELKEDKKIKKEDYYEQPPSDSDFDICGPMNCDKEL